MSEQPRARAFPRRDSDGRVESLAEMLVAALLGTVVGAIAVTLIDGLFALIGLGDFGSASGWLAATLPVFLFLDDFRGWRQAAGWRRWLVALVGAVAGVGAGLAVAGLASGLPPLASGALAAAALALVYSVAWFSGVRVMTR